MKVRGCGRDGAGTEPLPTLFSLRLLGATNGSHKKRNRLTGSER
jgi:hypothetical protein